MPTSVRTIVHEDDSCVVSILYIYYICRYTERMPKKEQIWNGSIYFCLKCMGNCNFILAILRRSISSGRTGTTEARFLVVDLVFVYLTVMNELFFLKFISIINTLC